MKRLKSIVAALSCAAALALIGCSEPDESGPSLPAAPAGIQAGYIRVNYKGSADCLWIWNDFDGSELEKQGGWPNGVSFTHQNGDFVCVDLKLAENPTKLGMIPLKGGTSLSGDDIIFNFPVRYNEIFLQANDKNAYVSSDMKTLASGIYAAAFTDSTIITLSGAGVTLSANTVTLKNKNGAVQIASYDNEKLTLTLSAGVKDTYATTQPYTLTVGDDVVTVGLDSSLTESWYGAGAVKEIASSSLKLGVTVDGSKASFKTWTPLASKVQLLLYTDSAHLDTPTQTIDMKPGTNGFWTAADVDFGANKYYKYAVTNGQDEKHVSDIWSYAASADSVASQIADISKDGIPENWEMTYTNPFGNSGAEKKNYTDAVIYEMHIRDWSRAVVSDSTGKFLDVANSAEIINYLKDIGVTHVQILPMFDYAQTNNDPNYNWGYNPYHYNVPEGRYVKDMKDGTDAVKQMRQMIKALHDAGIAVNMDVVYNHTNGTKDGSLYDMTVPEYFYRMTNGGYSNGSGCGNETATNHAMVKYYVIESLKHWMTDYHINGFRFDLMGVHEKETMKEIYEALYKIDPNVMVYGEPWTGGTAAVTDSADAAVAASVGSGAGAFDDDFRDAIKGAEFGGFKLGSVQGKYNDDGIINGLKGISKRNATGNPALSLHYAECHDNYTLYDKLVYSAVVAAGNNNIVGKDAIVQYFDRKPTEAQVDTIRAQNKLAAAYIFLAQGTPFINGGQEFMRTKNGNPDSYSADTKGGQKWTNEPGEYNIDDCNTISLSRKEMYSDVYNTYKALIKIRKDIDAFRNGSYPDASVYNKTTGVVKYSVYSTDGSENYVVYFNASDAAVACTDKGKKFSINESDGTYRIADAEAEVGSVPAKSFVILKK